MDTSLDNSSFDDGYVNDFDDVFGEQKYEFGECVRVSALNPYRSRLDIVDAILNDKPLPSPRCASANCANEATSNHQGTDKLDVSTDISAENASRKDEIDEHPSSDLKESDARCDKAIQTAVVKRTAVIVKRDVGSHGDEVQHRSSAFSCHDNALFAAGYRPQRSRSAGNSAALKWMKERKTAEVNLLPGNRKILHSLRQTSSPTHSKVPLDESQRNDLKTRRLYEKLSRYLTLVYDYPKAFRKLRFLAASDPNMAPCVRRVMLMGRAFGDDFGRRESPVLIAAYELGSRRRLASAPPKEPLPSQPTAQKTHKLMVKATKPRDRSRSPECDNREPFEKNLLAQHGEVVAGLWKAREEAEKVLASASTCDGMRAREWVLKELGENEGSVQQWWVSQRQCRYLRRRSATDTYDWQDTKS